MGSADQPKPPRRWVIPGGVLALGGGAVGMVAMVDVNLARKMVDGLWSMIQTASPLGAAIFFMLMLDAMAKAERANQQRDASYQREREMALQYVQSMNQAGSRLDDLAKAYGTLSTLVTNHLIKRGRQ